MEVIGKDVTLGKVGAVYGIKGWLKIHSFTDDQEAILDYFPWSLKLGNKIQSVDITDWRKHNNGLVVKVAGIESYSLILKTKENSLEWLLGHL